MHWEQGREFSSRYVSEYMVRISTIGYVVIMLSKIGSEGTGKYVVFVVVSEQRILKLIEVSNF